jgi:hypothetical protein
MDAGGSLLICYAVSVSNRLCWFRAGHAMLAGGFCGYSGVGAEMPDRLVVDLGGNGQAAVLAWPEGGLPEEVARAPLAWPLDGDALEDLRWYLEDYLLAPFGVWEEHGPAVRDKLDGWGDQVFSSVFGAGPARDAYQRARDRGLEVLFRSAEPGLLGLPWELMRDGSGPVAWGRAGSRGACRWLAELGRWKCRVGGCGC